MAVSKRFMKKPVTDSRKTIDGVVHVWDIHENTWVPEKDWDDMQRQLTKPIR